MYVCVGANSGEADRHLAEWGGSRQVVGCGVGLDKVDRLLVCRLGHDSRCVAR